MRPTLNLLAGALLIIWMVEFFGYGAGENIHILLLLAIIFFLGKRVFALPTGKLPKI